MIQLGQRFRLTPPPCLLALFLLKLLIVVLGVTSDGRLTIRPEYFSGKVRDGHASYLLYSINHYSEINNGRLVLFTPVLGEPVYVGGDPVAFIRPVAGSASLFTVQAVYSSVAWLPALSGRDVLVGSGDAAYWLATTLHRGDRITVTDRVAPDPGLAHIFTKALNTFARLVLHKGSWHHSPALTSCSGRARTLNGRVVKPRWDQGARRVSPGTAQR
jgi:hypothetical protein